MYTTACVKGDSLVIDYHDTKVNGSDAASSDLLAVGRAYTGGRVKVVDPDTGNTLPRGYGSECVGELHFGGDTVIKEYLGGQSPDSFYTEDGCSWFKTGDQGRMATDGSIFMLGRYKDMIKRGGENIFPQQLEYTLQSVCSTKVCLTTHNEKVSLLTNGDRLKSSAFLIPLPAKLVLLSSTLQSPRTSLSCSYSLMSPSILDQSSSLLISSP